MAMSSAPKLMLALSSRMSSMYLEPKIGMIASFYDGQSYGSPAGSSGSKAISVPKRPSGSFMSFSIKVRPQITANNPGMPADQYSPIIAQKWKDLSEDEVKTYKTDFERALEEYKRQIESLKANPKGLAALAEVKEASRIKSMHKAARQKKRLEQKLGRRPNGFHLYVKQNYEAERAKTPEAEKAKFTHAEFLGAVIKALSQSWATISDAKRATFKAKAEDMKAIYKKDLEAWKTKEEFEKATKLGKRIANFKKALKTETKSE